MVRKLYESHARPFARVVHGLPMSWDGTTAAAIRPSGISVAAWSPCDRFIAIIWDGTMKVEVLDSATLQRLQTPEPPQPRPTFTSHSVLAFSPDSRILTCSGANTMDLELFVISWDLQTGDMASVIRQQGSPYLTEPSSITYLADGKTVGVHCRCPRYNFILVFDVASGVFMHSHSPVDSSTCGTWIHGESLRFATINPETITIWDAGSAKVETFPFPKDVHFEGSYFYARSGRKINRDWWELCQFLPAPCRLAFNLDGDVRVWDVQNSKYLLYCTDVQNSECLLHHTGARFQCTSFSSDGRFFACSTGRSGVYLWKESATGDYILHEILAFNTIISYPLLSRNGESIVVFGDTIIRLWRTKGHTPSPSSAITRAPQHTEAFLLDFSPNGMLAAVARRGDKTVTVLNPKSGVLQLTIDTGMGVYGLRVTKNTIAVVGDEEFITWDLPTGHRVPGTKMTREDSVRSTNLNGVAYRSISISASISPNPRHLAIFSSDPFGPGILQLYDGSTGEKLAQWESENWELARCTTWRGTPCFAPGGRDLWLVGGDGCGEVFRVDNRKQAQWDPKRRVDIEDPPKGYPWASSRGYQVTDSWWILGPDEKRLLMLPLPWQSYAMRRVWNGQFLALLHGELPEPVILELYQ